MMMEYIEWPDNIGQEEVWTPNVYLCVYHFHAIELLWYLWQEALLPHIWISPAIHRSILQAEDNSATSQVGKILNSLNPEPTS